MLRRVRYTAIVCLSLTFCSLLVYFRYTTSISSYLSNVLSNVHSDFHSRPPAYDAHNVSNNHPIDRLIRETHSVLGRLLEKRSETLEQAAQRYRERRGRHPPPGFDTWFAEAKKQNAVVVEDFFDRIYHDLTPLWALVPLDLRRQTNKQPYVIRVRNGVVEEDMESDTPFSRADQWTKLVKEMMPHIPDLDMPINQMDESRVMVPWEKINEYVGMERAQRGFIEAHEAITEYSRLGDADNTTERFDPGWIRGETRKYWDHLSAACPPDSPGYNVSSLPSFDVPVDYPQEPVSAYTFQGYIQNVTGARDPCLQPHLRGLHGSFIDSISMATTHTLTPIFGESKLPQNNDILIPGAVYLDDGRELYSGGQTRGGQWTKKKNAMVWRGVASGARNKPGQWRHSHRQRFLQMLNGTTVASAQEGNETEACTFQLPSSDLYSIPAQREGRLGKWVSSFTDMGFTNLLCDPNDGPEHRRGIGKRGHVRVAGPVVLAREHDAYEGAVQPQVPARHRRQLVQRAIPSFPLIDEPPLKSTVYAEWHDDRIFPWLHYVPVDNTFMDIYAIMDYFLSGRDAQAETIAMEGKRWAELVLRREDMRLYVWRLLLEYARVVDDKRDRLAYVADLRK